jgi:hypothetical protein
MRTRMATSLRKRRERRSGNEGARLFGSTASRRVPNRSSASIDLASSASPCSTMQGWAPVSAPRRNLCLRIHWPPLIAEGRHRTRSRCETNTQDPPFTYLYGVHPRLLQLASHGEAAFLAPRPPSASKRCHAGNRGAPRHTCLSASH